MVLPARNVAPSLDVVLATSPAYVPHAAATLHSLLRNSPGARPHLVHAEDLPSRDADQLRDLCSSFGVHLDLRHVRLDRLDGIPPLVGNRLPVHSWFRTLIPTVFPELPRALYLDVDLVVLRSLLYLADCDLGGSVLGAVEDAAPPGVHDQSEVGLRAGVPYLNSGVLLLDLEEIRRQGFMTEVLSVARKHGDDLRYGDQDALNVVLQGDWHRLHPRWNYQTMAHRDPDLAAALYGVPAAQEAVQDPAIVHFTSYRETGKPWHALSRHPYRGAYWAHRQATVWRSALREGTSPKTLATGVRVQLSQLLGRRPADPPPGPLPTGYPLRPGSRRAIKPTGAARDTR